MAELHLDTHATLNALQATTLETDAQLSRHTAVSPDFPPVAAGAGFSAHGEALAQMLAAVHGVGTQRIDALRAATQAATRQVRLYQDTEQDFAAALEPHS